MNFQKLKDKFLSEFSPEIIQKLPASFSALIDESVESIVNGSSTVDGKTPSSEDEVLNLLQI